MLKEFKKRGKIDYTLAGRKLLSLIWRKTQDGIMLGFPEPELGEIHLSLVKKEGRFFWHIKDGRESEKIKQYPFGMYLPSDEFEKRISELTRRYVRQYHGNKTAWIMTVHLKKRIKQELDAREVSQLRIPLEIMNMGVRCNFNDESMWERIRIRDMFSCEESIGLVQDREVIRMVIPLDSKKAIFVSKRQLKFLQNRMMRLLGFNEYLHYVEPDLKKRITQRAKRISQRGKSKS